MADSTLSAAVHPTDRLIVTSPPIVALCVQIRHLASFDTVGSPYVPTVLLQGETSTGNGLVARILHDSGPRASRPFIWQCGAGGAAVRVSRDTMRYRMQRYGIARPQHESPSPPMPRRCGCLGKLSQGKSSSRRRCGSNRQAGGD